MNAIAIKTVLVAHFIRENIVTRSAKLQTLQAGWTRVVLGFLGNALNQKQIPA